MKHLNLHLTEAARAHIAMLLRNQQSGSMPALFFASGSSETDAVGTLVKQEGPHWYFGVYTKDQIEQLAGVYAANGYPLIYSAEGFALCVPQPQMLPEVAGKTLDVHERQVSIR